MTRFVPILLAAALLPSLAPPLLAQTPTEIPSLPAYQNAPPPTPAPSPSSAPSPNASPTPIQTSSPDLEQPYLSPARKVPRGKAPGLKSRLVKDTPDEKVYALIFSPGDEVLSGLTDFAIAHSITDAHFTAIGDFNSATVAWFDKGKKLFRRIPITQSVEVLSMVGDIAVAIDGTPIVHTHVTLGKEDGTVTGGHLFEGFVNPTLELFLTSNAVPLSKLDSPAGIKVIDPSR